MRSPLALCLALVFLLGSVSPATALPASEVNNGMLFGGQWTPANTTAVQTSNFSDLKAVTEVYTATWCDNCVDVEHALEDVKAEGHLIQYHFNSTLSDPFGVAELEQRWRDKYEPNSPPGVVFNGTMKKVGSVADDGTLQNEFTNLAKQDLGLGQGTTSFSWTPGACEDVFACGTMTWDLAIDEEHLENASLTVYAYVVETAADYEEGTNGLGTYPHIVRDMIDVGNESQGSMMVSLPTPHDGDDLEIHLLYEIMPNPPEVMEEEPEPTEPSEDTPALSVVSTMMVVGLALAFTQRIRRDR